MQIDTTSEFGQRVQRRLSEESVIWLTTVDPDGAPQPTPVWQLWDGETVLIYSMPNTAKLRNIAANQHVSLNFNSDAYGGDVIVITGTARVDAAALPLDKNAPYLAKYQRKIEDDLKMSIEACAQSYSVAIRLTPAKVRGH